MVLSSLFFFVLLVSVVTAYSNHYEKQRILARNPEIQLKPRELDEFASLLLPRTKTVAKVLDGGKAATRGAGQASSGVLGGRIEKGRSIKATNTSPGGRESTAQRRLPRQQDLDPNARVKSSRDRSPVGSLNPILKAMKIDTGDDAPSRSSRILAKLPTSKDSVGSGSHSTWPSSSSRLSTSSGSTRSSGYDESSSSWQSSSRKSTTSSESTVKSRLVVQDQRQRPIPTIPKNTSSPPLGLKLDLTPQEVENKLITEGKHVSGRMLISSVESSNEPAQIGKGRLKTAETLNQPKSTKLATGGMADRQLRAVKAGQEGGKSTLPLPSQSPDHEEAWEMMSPGFLRRRSTKSGRKNNNSRNKSRGKNNGGKKHGGKKNNNSKGGNNKKNGKNKQGGGNKNNEKKNGAASTNKGIEGVSGGKGGKEEKAGRGEKGEKASKNSPSLAGPKGLGGSGLPTKEKKAEKGEVKKTSEGSAKSDQTGSKAKSSETDSKAKPSENGSKSDKQANTGSSTQDGTLQRSSKPTEPKAGKQDGKQQSGLSSILSLGKAFKDGMSSKGSASTKAEQKPGGGFMNMASGFLKNGLGSSTAAKYLPKGLTQFASRFNSSPKLGTGSGEGEGKGSKPADKPDKPHLSARDAKLSQPHLRKRDWSELPGILRPRVSGYAKPAPSSRIVANIVGIHEGGIKKAGNRGSGQRDFAKTRSQSKQGSQKSVSATQTGDINKAIDNLPIKTEASRLSALKTTSGKFRAKATFGGFGVLDGGVRKGGYKSSYKQSESIVRGTKGQQGGRKQRKTLDISDAGESARISRTRSAPQVSNSHIGQGAGLGMSQMSPASGSRPLQRTAKSVKDLWTLGGDSDSD